MDVDSVPMTRDIAVTCENDAVAAAVTEKRSWDTTDSGSRSSPARDTYSDLNPILRANQSGKQLSASVRESLQSETDSDASSDVKSSVNVRTEKDLTPIIVPPTSFCKQQYQCRLCPSVFSNRWNCVSHMRAHQRVRVVLECPQCGKKCSKQSELDIHLRIHTGEKPFPCTVCHRRFTRQAQLNSHMRSHSGTKPFLCCDCGASFVNSSNLKRHYQLHAKNGNKPPLSFPLFQENEVESEGEDRGMLMSDGQTSFKDIGDGGSMPWVKYLTIQSSDAEHGSEPFEEVSIQTVLETDMDSSLRDSSTHSPSLGPGQTDHFKAESTLSFLSAPPVCQPPPIQIVAPTQPSQHVIIINPRGEEEALEEGKVVKMVDVFPVRTDCEDVKPAIMGDDPLSVEGSGARGQPSELGAAWYTAMTPSGQGGLTDNLPQEPTGDALSSLMQVDWSFLLEDSGLQTQEQSLVEMAEQLPSELSQQLPSELSQQLTSEMHFSLPNQLLHALPNHPVAPLPSELSHPLPNEPAGALPNVLLQPLPVDRPEQLQRLPSEPLQPATHESSQPLSSRPHPGLLPSEPSHESSQPLSSRPHPVLLPSEPSHESSQPLSSRPHPVLLPSEPSHETSQPLSCRPAAVLLASSISAGSDPPGLMTDPDPTIGSALYPLSCTPQLEDVSVTDQLNGPESFSSSGVLCPSEPLNILDSNSAVAVSPSEQLNVLGSNGSVAECPSEQLNILGSNGSVAECPSEQLNILGSNGSVAECPSEQLNILGSNGSVAVCPSEQLNILGSNGSVAVCPTLQLNAPVLLNGSARISLTGFPVENGLVAFPVAGETIPTVVSVPCLPAAAGANAEPVGQVDGQEMEGSYLQDPGQLMVVDHLQDPGPTGDLFQDPGQVTGHSQDTGQMMEDFQDAGLMTEQFQDAGHGIEMQTAVAEANAVTGPIIIILEQPFGAQQFQNIQEMPAEGVENPAQLTMDGVSFAPQPTLLQLSAAVDNRMMGITAHGHDYTQTEAPPSTPRKTQEKAFMCDLCPRRFSRQWYLSVHRKAHLRERAFTCEVCHATFSRVGNLNRHRQLHTGSKPFQCQHCAARFANRYRLAQHERRHEGVKPFSCGICRNNFTDLSSLQRHQQTHEGEDLQHTCEICGASFRTMHSLTSHLKVHIKEEGFGVTVEQVDVTPADVPVVLFDLTKLNLSETAAMPPSVLKVETDKGCDNNFLCSVCHKSFPFSAACRQHIFSHLGARPYKCMDCGATFSRKACARRHTETHRREKRNVCGQCGKKFQTKPQLLLHGEEHLSPRLLTVACDQCDGKFSEERMVAVHKKIFHRQMLSLYKPGGATVNTRRSGSQPRKRDADRHLEEDREEEGGGRDEKEEDGGGGEVGDGEKRGEEGKGKRGEGEEGKGRQDRLVMVWKKRAKGQSRQPAEGQTAEQVQAAPGGTTPPPSTPTQHGGDPKPASASGERLASVRTKICSLGLTRRGLGRRYNYPADVKGAEERKKPDRSSEAQPEQGLGASDTKQPCGIVGTGEETHPSGCEQPSSQDVHTSSHATPPNSFPRLRREAARNQREFLASLHLRRRSRR